MDCRAPANNIRTDVAAIGEVKMNCFSSFCWTECQVYKGTQAVESLDVRTVSLSTA